SFIEERRHAVAPIGLHLTSVRARVLARQDAAAKWRPRSDAEAQLARHRYQLAFYRALDERILYLQRVEGGPTTKPGDGLGLSGLPRRCVGKSNVTHFACAHEIVERPHRLFDRSELVPQVHPVQVDVVRLKTTKGLLAGGHKRLAAGAAAVWVARVQIREKFRGNDDPIAFTRVARKILADDPFRVAESVPIGSIDKISAALEKATQDRLRLRYGRAPAPLLTERHRAKAQRTDPQAGMSEGDIVVQGHDVLFSVCPNKILRSRRPTSPSRSHRHTARATREEGRAVVHPRRRSWAHTRRFWPDR